VARLETRGSTRARDPRFHRIEEMDELDDDIRKPGKRSIASGIIIDGGSKRARDNPSGIVEGTAAASR